MYILLFFLVAPLGAGVLMARALFRFRSEPRRRAGVVLVTLLALALWGTATSIMLLLDYGTAMGLAHARPLPSGSFPEGWRIYAATAAYVTLGLGLFAVVGKVPRKQPDVDLR
jgi:hypothetical protein